MGLVLVWLLDKTRHQVTTRMTKKGNKHMNRKVIALDFDGVIHKYSKKWHDGTIYDEPVPGAKEAIEGFINAGYEVIIFTCRPDLIELHQWMKQKLGITGIFATNTKPIADIYIDDNGLRFHNWTQVNVDLVRLGIL